MGGRRKGREEEKERERGEEGKREEKGVGIGMLKRLMCKTNDISPVANTISGNPHIGMGAKPGSCTPERDKTTDNAIGTVNTINRKKNKPVQTRVKWSRDVSPNGLSRASGQFNFDGRSAGSVIHGLASISAASEVFFAEFSNAIGLVP